MKAHRWQKEIHAWADGAQIERRLSGERDWTRMYSHISWDLDGAEFRVKPERKMIRYRVALIHSDAMWDEMEALCVHGDHAFLGDAFVRWLTDWAEVEL